MELDLRRPDQLDDEAWTAIESYRARLEVAIGLGDRPLVVGASKDLIESVARVVLDATGHPMGDNAKFPALVAEAQTALSRTAGKILAVTPIFELLRHLP